MSKPILFVVEDNQDTVQRLERVLDKKYGDRYRVLGSTSAVNALKKLRQLKDENLLGPAKHAKLGQPHIPLRLSRQTGYGGRVERC